MATTTAEKTLAADALALTALGPGPLPDPPPMMDMNQEPYNTVARSILRTRYADDPTVFVAGEGYLFSSRTYPRITLVPDCMVSFDVDADAARDANGYVIDEVGKPPDFVLEVATASATRREYREKPRVYEAMKVPEYWRFDYTGGTFYDPPLAGDMLSDNGLYVPIETLEDEVGGILGYSPALDLGLYWDNGRLRFFDPLADEFLLNHAESKAARLREARLAAEARLDAEVEAARLRRMRNGE